MLNATVLIVILGMFAAGAFGQTKTRRSKPVSAVPAATRTAPDHFPVETTAVEGNQNLAKEKILEVAGVRAGQPGSKADFDAARDRLVATGMFETVGYRYAPGGKGGYALTFEVLEMKPLFALEFEGLPAQGPEIVKYLKTRNPLFLPKLPGTTAILDQYARAIENYLASVNHPEKVLGTVISTGPEQFKILFRPAAPLPVIAEVRFTGNNAILTPRLQHAISGVAYGVPFTQDGFRQLLDAQIRPLYDGRGLVRVQFPKITTSPAEKVKGLVVDVTIEEGTVYRLGSFAISGAESRADGADLLKQAAIKPGEFVNFDAINEGVETIKRILKKNGYLRVQAEVDRKIDDAAKKVDVAVRLDRGPQFHTGTLTIQGLDLNSEPAVRKLWGAKQGAPFNASYPDYFLARIREDGIFDSLGTTKAVTNIDEDKHVADVTLIFGAAPPRKPDKPKVQSEPF